MPELRRNLATGEWIIAAPERAKRPDQFIKEAAARKRVQHHEAECPFCEGHEEQAPNEVFAIREKGSKPNGRGWEVRVLPNKFPALVPSEVSGLNAYRSRVGIHLRIEGVGNHEVIIETPDHELSIGTMPVAQVEKVLAAYKERYLALDRNPDNELIIIFRNHGERAGTSLPHPHSQLVTCPIVPSDVRNRMIEGVRYYDETGMCVYCDLLAYEVRDVHRVVAENDDFVALCPYASSVPYEMWVIPRRHQASFGEIEKREQHGFAAILRAVLGKLHQALNDPDYNYVIHTAPHHSATVPHYHWHLQVTPRLTTPAGFEIGSGISINITLPEQSAKHLREAAEA